MKFIRRTIAIALVTMLCLIFTACGGGMDVEGPAVDVGSQVGTAQAGEPIPQAGQAQTDAATSSDNSSDNATQETEISPLNTVTVATEGQLRGAVASAGNTRTNIVLTTDIELASDFIIPTGAEILMSSEEGHQFSLIASRSMHVVTIEQDASLAIANIGITRTEGTHGYGVWVRRNASFTMHSGIINGNGTTVRDTHAITGVRVSSGGAFMMNGGEIMANNRSGVSVEGGKFVLNNGLITSNTYRSGVLITSTDGSRGSFIMNGGEISHNVDGGGVSISRADFVMRDGRIAENSSDGSGGGISVGGHSSFTMYGGEISGNTARQRGGGIMAGGETIINDGLIYNNSAGLEGGGISVWSMGPLVVNGGVIRGNSSERAGGGVALYGGNFTITGGWIFDNHAETDNDFTIFMGRGNFNNNIFDENNGAIGSGPPAP